MSDVTGKVLDAVAGLFCVWMILDALRTGKARVPVPMNEVDYSRKDEPLAYWLTVVALTLAFMIALGLFLGAFS